MTDPYNEYPPYPAAPSGGTGFPQDGQYHSPPYQYGEPYSHNIPHEYQYPPYDANQPPQTYQNPAPEEPSFGTTQESPFEPSAGTLHPGTEVGPYEPKRPGENMSYYAPTPDKRRYSRSPSPRPLPDSSLKRQTKGEADFDSSEDERGLGGTLAGGALGYYVGHKKRHGFLGTLGGAILGSYLEEKLKDKRDEDRDSHRHGHHGHSHHGHHHGGHRYHDHDHDHDHHHHHHGDRSRSRHSRHDSSLW